MNFRFLLLLSLLWVTGGLRAAAQVPEPDPTTPPAAAAVAPAAPPVPPSPAPTPAPVVPPAEEAAPAVVAADQPVVEPTVPEPAAKPAQSDTVPAPDVAPALSAEGESETKPAPEQAKPGKRPRRPSRQNDSLVNIGHGSTLAAGEKADAVVSIMGSSSSAGTVADSIVSIMGNTRVSGGSVGDSAVAIMGNLSINGRVKGDAVAIMGNVTLGPDAVVDGEVVCIGGKVTRDEHAVVQGGIENLGLGNGVSLGGLSTWFTDCLLRGRLLAFDPAVTWAWIVAALFLGFYLLLALVFPAAVNRSVRTLEEQPGYTVLTAVLTLVLTPVVYLLLVFTLLVGVGFVLIPVFSLGLFFAGLFGTAVMLAWLGRRGTGLLGLAEAPPVLAMLLGGIVVMLLYTVPWAGMLIHKLIGVLGLGTVIYTLIVLANAKKAVAAAATAAAIPPLPVVVPAGGGAAFAAETAGLPPVVSAATLPRAGFWLRLAAAALDAVLIGILSAFLPPLGGGYPLWLAVYAVVMWATKGTTIGGIVCGLKVVRLDDRPVDWSVAIVRGLMAFVSLIIAGLGFIWVAFDDEKQSWHDKVAGTTIVRVPKGTALL